MGHTVALGLGRIEATAVELRGYAYGLGAVADIKSLEKNSLEIREKSGFVGD